MRLDMVIVFNTLIGNSNFCAQTSEELVHKQHQDSADINNCESDLLNHWQKLREASERKSKHLEEVRDLLEFNRQAEKAEAWIREKISRIY